MSERVCCIVHHVTASTNLRHSVTDVLFPNSRPDNNIPPPALGFDVHALCYVTNWMNPFEYELYSQS